MGEGGGSIKWVLVHLLIPPELDDGFTEAGKRIPARKEKDYEKFQEMGGSNRKALGIRRSCRCAGGVGGNSPPMGQAEMKNQPANLLTDLKTLTEEDNLQLQEACVRYEDVSGQEKIIIVIEEFRFRKISIVRRRPDPVI